MAYTSFNSPLNVYKEYLYQICPNLEWNSFSTLVGNVEQTNWNNPKSAFDFNNVAVINLIEAESAQDKSSRAFHLEKALTALQQGSEFKEYPLCLAHLALVRAMIGQIKLATQIAFSTLIERLQVVSTEDFPIGLIYLPQLKHDRSLPTSEQLKKLLIAKNGDSQTLLFLSEVLCCSRRAFYNSSGIRFLQLASHINPDSATLNLKLGLATLGKKQWEGLLYLKRAQEIAPNYSPIIQALYLVNQQLNNQKVAELWRESACHLAKESRFSLTWKWAELGTNSPFTYIPFDNNLLLSIEANLHSIVTRVLIAEGDWFEAEVEFWRDQLQPEMTVIDVGASVGVYTFSAAHRVGFTGQVIAIEPFSNCVRCLQETRRINELSWVSIYAAAASDHHGMAKLALHNASELNEVLSEELIESSSGNFEEISCFPLDSLIDRENLERVDWLKIDAEGHEMKVLAGSDHLLSRFSPCILYENIAGNKGCNFAVAEILKNKGYQLFRYQPFLKELAPINSLEDLSDQLNVVALPSKK